MIINRLRLSNFRSFETATLEFSDSQNYIFGHNWQGKSSIVDAIGFVLFGADVFPRKLAGTPVKAEHLINEGAKSGSIELSFELNGEEYRLRRTIPTREVSLWKGDVTIASGTNTIKEKLADLAGIDVKLFQNIFYSDQDELRKSLEFTPESRRIFIERILGAEEWKERIEFFRTTAKQLKQFLEDLISGRLGAFLEALDELSTAIDGRKKELDEKQRKLSQLQKTAPKNLHTLRREELDSSGEILKLDRRRIELNAQLNLQKELSSRLSTGTCPVCLQSVAPAARKSRIEALTQTVNELKAQAAQITADLLALQKRYQQRAYEDSYEALGDVRELEAEVRVLKIQLEEDEGRLKKMRKEAKSFGKKPDQVERTKAELLFLSRLEEVVQLYRRSLRERIVEQLQFGMNDFLSRFHDGDNDMAVVIDGDMNVAVKLHGQICPIFNLSGAAKDILALALRYGLLRVAARGVNFMVLDEPTRHMDETNCQRLKGIFNDLLDRQLIVVTINNEFADADGKHFMVTKDDTMHSRITRVW